jgi:thiamine pyrophosphokinase
VVTGGDAPTSAELQADVFVIAADSGADTAHQMGLRPALVVGDLDSISPTTLDRLLTDEVPIDRHDVDKDQSDLELALEQAVARRPLTVTVLGGGQGSLGHLLVNAGVIASPRYRHIEMRWCTADANVSVVHAGSDRSVAGAPGDLVTLVAFGGDAIGVTTTGLRWALEETTIEVGSSLGLSNEMLGTGATISLAQGTLLAIHERTSR